MTRTFCWTLVGILLVSLLLAGCGGGSSSGPSLAPGIALQIGGNAAILPAQGMTRGVTLGAKLDAGALVTILNFATGQQLATGTIDASGFARVTITPGLTVVAVITGTRNGKQYRLSYLVPSVPDGDAQFIADPVSSLAAESIAKKHYRASLIDQDTLNTATTAAAQYFVAHPEADIAVGGGLLASGDFGATGSLDAAAATPVLNAVPDAIDNNLVRGKNAIHQLTEAGLPMQGDVTALNDQAPLITTSGSHGMTSVTNGMMMGLMGLMGAMNSGMFISTSLSAQYPLLDATGNPILDAQNNPVTSSILKLPLGKGYRLVPADGFYADASLDKAGQITVIQQNVYQVDNPSDVTLIAKSIDNGTAWLITSSQANNRGINYELNLPIVDMNNIGPNPTLTGKLTLNSSTTMPLDYPIVLQGTFTAVGANAKQFTNVSFTGSITTAGNVPDAELPEVLGMTPAEIQQNPPAEKIVRTLTLSGTFAAAFPAALPAGAPQTAKTYDYPTSMKGTNLTIKVTENDINEVSLSGNVGLTTTLITRNGRPEIQPASCALDGRLTNKTPKSTVIFSGSTQVNLAVLNAATHPTVAVKTIALTQSVTVTTATMDAMLTGNFSANGTVVTENGVEQVRFTSAHMGGSSTNSLTKTTFNGSVDVKWEKTVGAFQEGTATVIGTLTKAGYLTYNVSVTFISNGLGVVTCTLNNITYGHFVISGAVVVTENKVTHLTHSTIDLTNQDGVHLHLDRSDTGGITGTIVTNDKQVATIDGNNHSLTFIFTDQTHDTVSI